MYHTLFVNLQFIYPYMELLIGIVLGILLSLFFSFGPSFFSLLQTSVHYGFRKSVPIAFGISLSDVLMVLLFLTVLSGVEMSSVLHNVYVASIGGVIMAIMGIYTFRRKAQDAEDTGSAIKFDTTDTKWYYVAGQGFLLNFFNPLIWLYWFSLISVVQGALSESRLGMVMLFGGVLIATLSLDILKCRLASLLHRVLTARVIMLINKGTGILLFGFAVYLVVSMILFQTHPETQNNNNDPTKMVEKVFKATDSISTNSKVIKFPSSFSSKTKKDSAQ